MIKTKPLPQGQAPHCVAVFVAKELHQKGFPTPDYDITCPFVNPVTQLSWTSTPQPGLPVILPPYPTMQQLISEQKRRYEQGIIRIIAKSYREEFGE
jgi:hypothetical protein